MPNHVANDLFVSGDGKDVAAFVTALKGERDAFDADRLIPYPEHFKAMDAAHKADPESAPRDGFNSGGYEWCRDNWGTKWGAYDCKLEYEPDDGEAFYTFQSAWSPPTPVVVEAAKRFPTLRIEHHFFERGMAFMGIHIYERGYCQTQVRLPYHGPRGG